MHSLASWDGDILNLAELASQHFAASCPLYRGFLVKAMEEQGIGRRVPTRLDHYHDPGKTLRDKGKQEPLRDRAWRGCKRHHEEMLPKYCGSELYRKYGAASR